jgi:DNA gyrase subunit B
MDSALPAGIETLTAVEGIRRRPEMYIGRALNDPSVPTILLRETFCLALDDVLGGCCNRIDVCQQTDDAVAVADNGPGIPVTIDVDNRSSLDVLMTELYACRDRKKHPHVAHRLCGAGLVVANALSERAAFDSYVDGVHWRQTFTFGHADAGPIRVADTDRTGKMITIKPDFAVIPGATYNFQEAAAWLGTLDLDGAALTVTLHRPDGATHTLYSTP